MCVAAYLALGGLGVSLTSAAHLRTALLWVCWSILGLLATRMTMRFIHRMRTVRRHEMTRFGTSARLT
jgi:hypothetical protein